MNQPGIKVTLENAPMLHFVSSRSAKARKPTSQQKSGCENFQLT
jgi:hypothetical protein